MESSGVLSSPSKSAVPSRRPLPTQATTTRRVAQSAKSPAGRGKVTASSRSEVGGPKLVKSVQSRNSPKTTNRKTAQPGARPNFGPKKHDKPSATLNQKTIDPFSTSTNRTHFESVYENGGIPCRLLHGSVRHKLHWETPPEKLHFDPLLITMLEGLSENRHPFTFIAREGVKELLMIEDAEEKAIPLVPRIVVPLKQALASTNSDVFERGLDALVSVSSVVGASLNPYLKSLLPQLSRKLMEKRYKERVMSCLQQLEYNGGKESLTHIKARVPTYQSISV